MVRSAAYRIAIVCSAAFALATVALGLIVYLSAHAAFARQLDSRIMEEAAALASSYQSEGRKDLIETIRRRELDNPANELAYALFAPSGRRIAGAMVTRMPAPGLRNIIFMDPREGPDPARAMTVALADGTRLVVAADREPLERIDATIVTLFGAAFAAVVVIGALGALALGAYLKRRLSSISATAEAIMAGDMSQRVAIGPRGDEFDRLAGLLNAMLDRITALLENLRQVSSDVAHDLRTPLSRLRNGLENGLRHPHPPDERDAAIEQAIARSDEVLALFAALLRLSEIEAGRLRQAFAPVDLTALVHDLCESYAPAVEDGGRRLLCRADEAVMITGDRELLSQAIINLLDNALIHTPEGTTITMDLQSRGGEARLMVRDNGPGIAEQDRERVTQRFMRLDASRTRPGHGLGLSLVAAVARIHEARMHIGDNRPGLVVSLSFKARQ
ncbi:MAG TPA: ATP-binding protein [Sphingomonas sp.]|nr:ATP-binding protein [Sphingomonas sp.]